MTNAESTPTPIKGNRRGAKRHVLYPASTPYLFVAPFVIAFLVLLLYPVVYAAVISLTKWVGGQFVWDGFGEYARLINDPVFWQSIVNTLIILVIQVPIMIGLAALFATLLNSPRLRFKGLFQLGFFLPILIDTVAYSLTFSFILGSNGVLNEFLGWFGIHPINWLLSPFWSKAAIMIALTWHWTGYNVVILLGGMQSMPAEVFEAAKIDGAGGIRQWFSITLPLLWPILFFEIVLSTIGTLQLFTETKILTGGGPGNSSLSPVLYLYQTGFQNFDFSYASAVAYAIAIIIAVLSFFQFRFTRGGAN